MRTITKRLMNVFLTLSMLVASAAMPAMAAGNRNAYEPLLASENDGILNPGENTGVDGNGMLGGIGEQVVLVFKDVDFGTLEESERITAIHMEVANGGDGGTITVTADPEETADKGQIEKTGKLVGQVTTPSGGTWDTASPFQSEWVAYNTLSGIHDIYITFSRVPGNFKSIRFEKGGQVNWEINQEIDLTKCTYTNASRNADHIGGNNDGTYIQINDVDFGDTTITEFIANVAPGGGGTLKALVMPENREAADRGDINANGIVIAQIETKGGDFNTYSAHKSTEIQYQPTGVNTVYLTTSGTLTGNLRSITFSDQETVIYKDPYGDLTGANVDEASEGLNITADGIIGSTGNGKYVLYQNVDFGDQAPAYWMVCKGVDDTNAGGTIGLYAGGMEDANLVTEMVVESTGDFNTYNFQTVELNEEEKAKLTGVQDIYLVFKPREAAAGNVSKIRFANSFKDPYAGPLYGEDADDTDLSPAQIEYNGGTHTKLGGTNAGKYVLYKNLDFGENFPAEKLTLHYGAPKRQMVGDNDDQFTKTTIKVYLDTMSGTPIYDELAKTTGGYSIIQPDGPNALEGGMTVSGIHDVYVTFGYSGTCDFVGIEFQAKVGVLEVTGGTMAATDASQKPVALTDGVLQGNAQLLLANCNVENNTLEDKTAVIILALYDGAGRLVQVEKAEESIESGAVKADFYAMMTVNGVEDTTGYKVKAMVWDSLEGMAPLPGGSL